MGKVSLSPSDAVKGGSLWAADGAVGTIRKARYEVFSYPGGQKATVVKPYIEDEAGVVHDSDVWTLGFDPTKCSISEDGKDLEVMGNNTGYRQGTNWDLFVISLINATGGADSPWNEKLKQGPAALDGLKAQFQRVDERRQIKDRATGAMKETNSSVLIVQKLLSGAGASASGSVAAGAAGANGHSDDLDAIASELVMDVMGEQPELKKGKLAIEINKRIMKDAKLKPRMAAILAKVNNAAFLQSLGAEVSGDTVKFG